jgi:hypothetical protein
MAEVKHQIVHALQKYVLNPPIKALFVMNMVPPGYALLETTGCKTGKARRGTDYAGADSGYEGGDENSNSRSENAPTNSTRKEVARTATTRKIGSAPKRRSPLRNSEPPPPDLCRHSQPESGAGLGPESGPFFFDTDPPTIHFNRRLEKGRVVLAGGV